MVSSSSSSTSVGHPPDPSLYYQNPTNLYPYGWNVAHSGDYVLSSLPMLK